MIARVQCEMARELYQAKKLEECLELCTRIVKEEKSTLIAPAASLLAIQAQLAIYSAIPASDKENKMAAMEKLEKIVKFTADAWPGKPEADDARIVLAQAALNRGETQARLSILDQVNPKSERYPASLALSGGILWEMYRVARKAALEAHQEPEAAAKEAMESNRKRAKEKLAAAVDRFKKAPTAKATPQQILAEATYAEILLEGGSYKEAVAVLDPLVAASKPDKPGDLEMTTVRIFLDALRTPRRGKPPEGGRSRHDPGQRRGGKRDGELSARRFRRQPRRRTQEGGGRPHQGQQSWRPEGR